MAKKKSDVDKSNTNKELDGFEVKINEFGEIITNYNVDKVNDFLDEHVDDKKLKDRPTEEDK